MNTATRARIRNFGSSATEARIAARVAANYTPEAWAADAAKACASRQEAAVQNQPLRPNAGTIDTLFSLAASRTPWVQDEAIRLYLETATAQQVAERIDWLQAQPVAKMGSNTEFKTPVQDKPAKADTAEVPEGRYAIDAINDPGKTRFYEVDRPTEGRWAGYVFVKVQAGDELHNIRNRQQREAILAQIAQDGVKEAMLRYGRELGHCGHCGRTLTNEESREYGIGPICRGKMGW